MLNEVRAEILNASFISKIIDALCKMYKIHTFKY